MSIGCRMVATVGLASALTVACNSELGGDSGGAQPCVVGGVTYQPGESFKCDCNYCQCVGGDEIISTTMWCGNAGSGGSAGGGSNPSGGSGGAGGSGGNGGALTTSVVPIGQTLTGLTVGWQGGFQAAPDASSTCDPRSFQNSIVVNVAESSIAWNTCPGLPGALQGHADVVQGQRPLAPEELRSVLTALQAVEVGAEATCPWSDSATMTLDVQTDQARLLYVADRSVCMPSAAGRTAVVNLEGFASTLDSLATN